MEDSTRKAQPLRHLERPGYYLGVTSRAVHVSRDRMPPEMSIASISKALHETPPVSRQLQNATLAHRPALVLKNTGTSPLQPIHVAANKIETVPKVVPRLALTHYMVAIRSRFELLLDSFSKQPYRKRSRRERALSTKNLDMRAKLSYGAAGLIMVIGIGVSVQGMFLNQQVKEQVKVLSASVPQNSTTSGSSVAAAVPSEEKPAPNYLDIYKVAADMPRIISIPSIGVKARVLQVGVDENNGVLTPKSVYDVAWYTGSAKPGENGAAFIDGHYVGPTANGVFSSLSKLKKDDKIMIERGDGKQLNFKVVSTETTSVDQIDMSKALASIDPAKPGLNLITCGGKYDAKTFKFANRTVVYTVLEK